MHLGQIQLPPGFMYDYGPPSPYEMFGLGAQQQVGSLSFFSVQFGCALLWLMSMLLVFSSWSNFDFIFGMVSLYAHDSLPFHSTLVEAACAILSSFILDSIDN